MAYMQGYMKDWSEEQQESMQIKQGWPFIFQNLRTVDEAGNEQPRDGRAAGELQAKGAHTIRAYLKVWLLCRGRYCACRKSMLLGEQAEGRNRQVCETGQVQEGRAGSVGSICGCGHVYAKHILV